MKKLIVIAIAASVAYATFAQTSTVDGITWNYTVSGGKATIYKGKYSAAISTSTKGAITIPSSFPSRFGTYSVTSIGDYAFCGCSYLTSVTIPDSVTSIGKCAFDSCVALTSISIPGSVKEVGEEAFWDCHALVSVNLGEGVEVLGEDAFADCWNLSNVSIPSTVREMWPGCFAFSKIDSITVAEGNPYFKSIDGVVYSKDGSRLVMFPTGRTGEWAVPDHVTEIVEFAFAGGSLSALSIGAGVEKIGDGIVVDSFNLTHVAVDAANPYFKDVDGILFSKDETRLLAYPAAKKDVSAYTVPATVTSVDQAAFGGSSLSGIILPSTFKGLWYETFVDCEKLESVIVGAGLETVGDNSFYYVQNLRTLTLPASVKTIERLAFEDCGSSATTIYVPEAAVSDEDAYEDCPAKIVKFSSAPLVKFNLNYDGAPDYPYDRNVVSGQPVGILMTPVRAGKTFAGWYTAASGGRPVTASTAVTSDVTFYAHWTENQYGVIIFDANGGECGESSRIVTKGNFVGKLPVPTRDGYEFLGWYAEETRMNATYVVTGYIMAVAHWMKLPVFTIEDGVLTAVELNDATDIVVPDNVTSIRGDAFWNCSGMTSVTIPNSVIDIWPNAFFGCSGLTNMVLPFVGSSRGNSGSFDSVFGYIFGTMYYKGGTQTRQYCSSSDSDCYYLPSTLKSVTITDETVLGYGAFSGCSGLTSVTIPSSVTSIGPSAFWGCSGLTSVTIPSSVTSIGDYAFSGCSGLTSVTIPDSVTNIGNCPFSNCSGLMSISVGQSNPKYLSANGLLLSKDSSTLIQGVNGDVIIPDSVTSIGDHAFSSCSGLTSVTIPNSVTQISTWAFSGCSGLTSVTIPDSVTDIGDYAFLGSSGLTSVTIPNSVTNIGRQAFSDCSGLTSVTIPDSVTSIGISAFYGCSGLTSVTIGNGVTSIGDRAFYNCSGLTSVTIPDSVTSIGNGAFNGCSKLANIFASIVTDDVLISSVGGALTNKIVWTDAKTGGDAEWAHDKVTVRSGFVSWESGAITHEQESWFEMDVDHPGRLSFWWKASSESDGEDVYDYAYLSVDGEAKGIRKVNGDLYRLEGVAIGGKTDWVNVVIDVDGAGPHTIRWTYCKDDRDEADTGDDCVWLDDIVWTPKVSVSYDISGASGVAPNGVAMLAGTTLTLPGAAGFSWTDHVFDGWSDGKNTYLPGETYEVPRTDVTFAAQWIRKSALTFALNGGSGAAPMTIKEVPGTNVTLPLATGLSKAKHTFAGWSDGATTYHEGAEYVIGDQDVVFVAVWTANTLAAPIISSVDVTNGGTIETVSATIAMSAEAGTEIHYTTDGSLPTAASPRYAAPFVADGMNVTIKAIAMRDNYFDSDVATFSFTRKPYSLSECLGMDGATVTTGGDSSWGRVLGGEAYDGVAALKSGSLGDSQTNWVQMVVSGPGTISFWWKVSSEGTNRGRRRDGCVFSVDGVEMAYSDGITNVWTLETFEVSEPGVHTLKWAYGKDGNGTFAGVDCAWLAEVVWTQGVDPSVPHWSIVYENLKGAANPNPSMYYEGYAVTFQTLPDVSGYTFAGWTPSSIPADATGDKTVTASWNWAPQDAVVESSITGGKALNVDAEWVKTELVQRFGAGKQQSFIAKFGDNFAAALTKKTGKRDGAGNELAVWHDYVAGTDPTDVNSTFKAKIEFKDGMPVVEWEPNLNSNGEVRIYTLYGKATLADAWHSPTNALDHFFKVDVAMPQDGTITFNVGGGSSVDPIAIRVGQPIGDLPTPMRQGYDFLGWFTAAEGGTEITPETIMTDDMTIFAHWEKRLAADLVHRWSFNGDLTDSVGGQTATIVGGVTTDGHKYSTPGGSSGSAYIDLGNWILPTNGSPVTIEMWVTQDASVSWSRIFCWGAMPNEGVFISDSNQNAPEWIQMRWDGQCDTAHKEVYLNSFSVGREYHVAAVIEPMGSGNWKATYYAKDADTGATLSTVSATLPSGWTIQSLLQTDMVLGQTLTTWNSCAKNSYNELRIWKKAMTEEELTASAIAGPDAEL